MADRTGVPEAPSGSQPHLTEAEQAALHALNNHVGTPAAPGCAECLDPYHWGDCTEGKRLRHAISAATRARVEVPRGC